jgi:60 kDa SS-A/Ro ribonucleoprotein
MARTNVPSLRTARSSPRTHEGTPAHKLSAKQELLRTVMTYLLWEDSHYEDGVSIAERIKKLVPKVSPRDVADIAIKAREAMKLRHTPLFLVRELARGTADARRLVADTLERVIQRADEATEFLALYWKDGKQPISAQVKKGLARAFVKFNEYELAKYNRDNAVKLRDVLFLTHAKPNGREQEELFKKLAANALAVPDTWEVALSGGADKKATFERLIKDNKLGALALLRNLRNMTEARCDSNLVRGAIKSMRTERVLPFRFIAAARYAPQFEPELEQAMFKCLEGQPKLGGRTALVVDTSPSMWMEKVSAKSEMDRFDAAAALAILLREICQDVSIWTFNKKAYRIPARRGFALRDSMAQTKDGYSKGGAAVYEANQEGYDRIIVLTDGQWHYSGVPGETTDYNGYHSRESMGDAKVVCPAPLTQKAYMINVANYQNGIGYGKWHTIDGWSEAIVDYIQAYENEGFAD